MKNWFTVEPDVVNLLNKHYTPGRGGAKIEFITRHHLAGILTTEQTWQVWQTRQASAHYVVENSGRIGQLVWDRDTAWANANAWANSRTIAIEHSNSSGNPSWSINDTVIREGARLAAALCWYYKLGRPVFGRNIRDHREFGSTSCPHHLANGGKYHNTWMKIAQEHYDWMVANPDGTPPTAAPTPRKEEEITVAEADRIIEFIKGYVGPIGSDVKDNRAQLTGGRDKGEYPGYPQIDDRTVVDALAVVGEKLGIPGFFDPHGGSLREKNEKEA